MRDSREQDAHQNRKYVLVLGYSPLYTKVEAQNLAISRFPGALEKGVRSDIR